MFRIALHHLRIFACSASVLLSIQNIQAASFYLQEGFGVDLTNSIQVATGQGAWSNNLWYGRAGTIIPNPLAGNYNAFMATLARQIFSNGKLEIIGEPNPVDGNSSRDGRWKGKWLWNTNVYYANAYEPFGWEIIRERAMVEPSSNTTASWVPNILDARKHAVIGLAMFRDNSAFPLNKTYSSNRTYEYENFERYFEFIDHGGCWASSNNDMRQMISYWDGSEISLGSQIVSAKRPLGNTTNVAAILNWNYLLNQNYSSQTNTNSIGFRLVHTGSAIAMYVNPNPYGTTIPYPNEWLYLDERQVTWSDKLQIMVGSEVYGFSGYLGAEYASGTFDNLLIRSATDGTGFFIDPTDNKETQLRVLLALNPRNAGVNDIRLESKETLPLPENLGLIADGKTLVYSGQKSFPKENEFQVIKISSTEWRIILGSQIVPTAVSRVAELCFQFKKQMTIDASIESYSILVNAEQFNEMPLSTKGRYATCGWQKALFIPGGIRTLAQR